MKKIILMFVVLITSITNAQTFDFGCEVSERQTRLNQIDDLETKYSVLSSILIETINDQTVPLSHVRYNYQVIQGTDETYYFGQFDYLEDVTEWDTKLQELEDQLNPNAGSTTRTDREAQLAALVGQHNVTSMTPFESGADAETLYAAASYTQNGNQITFPLSTEVGLIEDITDWSTKYSELVAKLIADSGIEPTTHAHRAGVLTSYNSIDGISNIEVKIDNPTNLSVATVYLEWELNGVAQDTYYFSATNPTVDSNGQVPGDLSYYEPGQFETNRERLYNKLIAHISVVSRLDQIKSLLTDNNAFFVSLLTPSADSTTNVDLGWIKDSKADNYDFGVFNTLDDVEPWADALQAFEDYLNPPVDYAALRATRIADLELLDDGYSIFTFTYYGEDVIDYAYTIETSNDVQTTFFTTDYNSGVYKIEYLTPDEYLDFKNDIIAYRDRLIRIDELEGLGVGNIVVEHGYHNDVNDAFTVSRELEAFTFLTMTYGAGKVENLDNRYTDLKNDIIAKVNVLNPLSDYNLGLELEDFYAKVNIHNPEVSGPLYGNQLPDVIEQLANLAEASNNNDVILEFLKKLSKGAIHQGLDSYLEWYQDTNIIVTNNGGVSNGFYDIPITDGVYLGAGNHQLKDLGPSNVRHLAYHIMSNFWHLANQDVSTLSGFRLQALVAKANSRGWYVLESILDNGAHYYEPRVGASSLITGFGTLIVSGFQSNALTLGDLTAANWETFYNKWVEKIDESI